MSDAEAEAAAAMAAAMAAALRRFNVELWTLYAFGVLITALRTYSRIMSVGFRRLWADDYLVWLAVVIYSAQSTLAFWAVNYAQGMANNAMTDEQRAALSPDSAEYEARVLGSKIQVVGWTTYVFLIGTLKMALLVFYIRLTEGLSRNYRIRVWAGFALVGVTIVASALTIYTSCLPFEKFWQINPNPGSLCQAADSPAIVWVTFSSSVVTDIYLILIPLPMLWGTSLKLVKKILSTVVLGAGIFVLVCSMLKTIFVFTDPLNGAQLAGEWGTREAFVSVVTTNLPMIFPLLKTWLKPLFGSAFSSNRTPYHGRPVFRTIGGTDGMSKGTGRRGTGNRADEFATNLSHNESEERIVDSIKMQDVKTYTPSTISGERPSRGIMVSNEFQITEERTSQNSEPNSQKVHERWYT
ncbi:hypothetical protein F5Y04DRAFT_33724 [Hypomontagnella monticulosa]|nr:hypothetical protein F5Y04DRAFT_33724 [Hypomontagnella monticulosa]